MANFKPTAYKKILDNEGLYANSPKDTGGETWRGISRNNETRWLGWAIIDRIKSQHPQAADDARRGVANTLNKLLLADPVLDTLVEPVYQLGYWDINSLSHLYDQQLADNVCDCGVNCGVVTAAKMLQRAINQIGEKSISFDGKIGPVTLSLVNSLPVIPLYDTYNQYRREYYDGIISRNPSQAIWRKSWYSRIVPYKK